MKKVIGIVMTVLLTLSATQVFADDNRYIMYWQDGESTIGRCGEPVVDNPYFPILPCPEIPDRVEEIQVEITLEYPQCVLRTNAPENLHTSSWGSFHLWEIPQELEFDGDGQKVTNIFNFLISNHNYNPHLVEVMEWEGYIANIARPVNLPTANKSYKGIEAEVNDCLDALEFARYNAQKEQETRETLEVKQSELKYSILAVQSELELQAELLDLTKQIIATQERVNENLMELRTIRMEGIEARSALWATYSAVAAEESEQFFQQMEQRQQNLQVIHQQITEDTLRHESFLRDLKALEAQAQSSLDTATERLTQTQQELQEIQQEIN